MKKSALAALVATLCLASCANKEKPHTLNQYLDQKLAVATTFEDSLVAIDGSFIGGFTAAQARTQSDRQGKEVDINEVIRGMREVMGVDTANASYLYGLQMGMEMLSVYKDLAASENINREQLLNTVIGAMRLDSLTQQQVMQIQPQFQQMFYAVQDRARARRDSIAAQSEDAKQNRMMAEAVLAKLQSNPDYKPAGDDGLLIHVITPGSETKLSNPNERVNIAYSITTIDGNQSIQQSDARPMYVGRPANEVLASVLPYMTLGEEAEFFVPYQLAYGTNGNERLGVGPCQSVMIRVSVTPVSD